MKTFKIIAVFLSVGLEQIQKIVREVNGDVNGLKISDINLFDRK